jgi:preprotein translocase subunit SecE
MSDDKSPKRGNIVAGFFSEVREELQKVTWPTRQDTLRLTLMVIGVSVIAGLFLGGIDYVFTQLTGLIL